MQLPNILDNFLLIRSCHCCKNLQWKSFYIKLEKQLSPCAKAPRIKANILEFDCIWN